MAQKLSGSAYNVKFRKVLFTGLVILFSFYIWVWDAPAQK
jgi:hypothetical protein